MKTELYIFVDPNSTIWNDTLGYTRSPVIKVEGNQIIAPERIDLGKYTLLDWFKEYPDRLKYARPKNLMELPKIMEDVPYYQPQRRLIKVQLDDDEAFEVHNTDDSNEGMESYYRDIRHYNSLVNEVAKIFEVIEPRKIHNQVFGSSFRKIIILACTEVEAHWQQLLRASGLQEESPSTHQYFRLTEFINFDNSFGLTFYPHFGSIEPFKGWDKERPTASLPWYDAYNKIKHDRELNIEKATLENALSSLAAVYTLVVIRHTERKSRKLTRDNILALNNPYNPIKHRVLQGSLKGVKYFHRFPRRPISQG